MLVTFIVFLAVLSILIFAHEFGHFIVAKRTGVRVEEFGIGYPPRIWGKKIGETIYSLNALPFGGFVRLYGEELAEKVKEKKEAFWAKSKKTKTMVICAGVLANFLLAIIAFSIVYSVAGIPTKTGQVKVVGIAPDSPADKIGLAEEDLVLVVDGQPLNDLNHFVDLIDQKKGNPVSILVEREKESLVFSLTPRESPPEGEGPLGVIVSDMEMVHHPVWQMPFRGAVEGFKEAFVWTSLVVGGLGKMLADLITQGKVPKDIAGPIGILQITGGVAQSGILAVLQFIGILSVNLAVINILPFPALDGGKLVFVAYEAITRRRPKPVLERWVNAAGMAILIFLISLVTINDIVRIAETTDFLSRLRSIWPF